jgi:hypothetical protein
MRIQGTGYVGIGTNSPAYMLHVSSNASANGAIISVDNPYTGTGGWAAVTVRNSGSSTLGGMRMGLLGTGWTTSGIYQQNGGFLESDHSGGLSIAATSNAGSVRFYAGGTTEVMRVNSNLNVGIGTTIPGYKLQVNGDLLAKTNIYLQDNNSTSNIKIGHITGDGAGDFHIYDWSTPRVIMGYFKTNNYVTFPNGNVGIGTNTPAYKLDVTGDIRASGEIISTGANNFRMVQGNYGIFGRNDGSDYYMMLTSSGIQYGSYNSLRPMRINLASGSVYFGNEQLYVQHGGNVGVGTTSPSYKLDVNGDIRVSGDWYWMNAKNFIMSAAANSAEWSFDFRNQGTYTGSVWQVWSDKNSRGILAVTGDTERVGVLTTTPSYTFHVVGDIYATGNVTAYSDARAKSNLDVITEPLNKVAQLTGYTYDMIDNPDLTTKITPRFTGIVAQELEKVLPEAVHKDKDGKYSVAYGNMAGLFVESIKELVKENKELKNRVSSLEERLEALERLIG